MVGAGEGAAAAAAGPLLSATAGPSSFAVSGGLIKENQQKIGSSFGTEKFKVSKIREGPVKG